MDPTATRGTGTQKMVEEGNMQNYSIELENSYC